MFYLIPSQFYRGQKSYVQALCALFSSFGRNSTATPDCHNTQSIHLHIHLHISLQTEPTIHY